MTPRHESAPTPPRQIAPQPSPRQHAAASTQPATTTQRTPGQYQAAASTQHPASAGGPETSPLPGLALPFGTPQITVAEPTVGALPAPAPYRPAHEHAEPNPDFAQQAGQQLVSDRRRFVRGFDRRHAPRPFASPWIAQPHGTLDPRPVSQPEAAPHEIGPMPVMLPDLPSPQPVPAAVQPAAPQQAFAQPAPAADQAAEVAPEHAPTAADPLGGIYGAAAPVAQTVLDPHAWFAGQAAPSAPAMPAAHAVPVAPVRPAEAAPFAGVAPADQTMVISPATGSDPQLTFSPGHTMTIPAEIVQVVAPQAMRQAQVMPAQAAPAPQFVPELATVSTEDVGWFAKLLWMLVVPAASGSVFGYVLSLLVS